MKRNSRASKQDRTGLACTVAMGLLVLLAWATLPRLSGAPVTPADSGMTRGSASTPKVDPHSIFHSQPDA